MKPIALTGGIAEGKSTILGFAAAAGVATIDADDVARTVWDDPRIQREIATLFDTSIPLSRVWVRERIAEDPELRRKLNRIMHAETLRIVLSSNARLVEVPLLIETCTQGHFQSVWVATCGAAEQRRRLIERLGSGHAADAMLGTQLPTTVKLTFADRVLRTNTSLPNVQSVVLAALAAESLI